MDDLLRGRAWPYYYNLAYSLPLYIHIDLRTDNQTHSCLVERFTAAIWELAALIRCRRPPGTKMACQLSPLKRYFASGCSMESMS